MRDDLDKILLTFLILVFLYIAVAFKGENGGFAVRSIDTLLGALLGIITGKYMALRSQGNKKDSLPPSDDTQPPV